MDRQLEEICQMEKENKGEKFDNPKVNLREGLANISQDEHGSRDEKICHNHQSVEEKGAKGGWSDPEDESEEDQSDNGYKANESESERDGDEGMEISDKEEWVEEDEAERDETSEPNSKGVDTTPGKENGDIWDNDE